MSVVPPKPPQDLEVKNSRNRKSLRWLIEVSPVDHISIVDLVCGSENLSGLLDHWWNLFQPHLEKYALVGRVGWPTDMLVSAVVFFYGCWLYLACIVSDVSPYVNMLVDYTLLYMLVDHYLDSRIIGNVALKEMRLVLDDFNFYPTDQYVREIQEVYLRLCSGPTGLKIKEKLISLFLAEVSGLECQKKSNLSFEKYLEVAMNKGGATFTVLTEFIKRDENFVPLDSSQGRDLGEIMQLLDDMLDVEQDKETGCHTVATHELKQKGNLDSLWYKSLDMIEALESPFCIWGWVYSLMLVYIPSCNPGCFSDTLVDTAHKYNPLALCRGVQMLTRALHDISR